MNRSQALLSLALLFSGNFVYTMQETASDESTGFTQVLSKKAKRALRQQAKRNQQLIKVEAAVDRSYALTEKDKSEIEKTALDAINSGLTANVEEAISDIAPVTTLHLTSEDELYIKEVIARLESKLEEFKAATPAPSESKPAKSNEEAKSGGLLAWALSFLPGSKSESK